MMAPGRRGREARPVRGGTGRNVDVSGVLDEVKESKDKNMKILSFIIPSCDVRFSGCRLSSKSID